MKFLLIILSIFLLTGCMTEKKASRITNEYLDKHPEVLAKKCADEFPVKDSTYIEGPVIHDTSWILPEWGDRPEDAGPYVPWNVDDTLYKAFSSGYTIGYQIAVQKCKERPIRIRIDTLRIRDYAQEQSLKYQMDALTKDNYTKQGRIDQITQDLKRAKKQRNIYLIILIVAAIGTIGAFYKKITGFFGF